MSDAQPLTFVQRFFTRKLIFWYALVMVLIADLASKAWADKTIHPYPDKTFEVIPGFLAWRWAENMGAAFSMLDGKVAILAFIAIGVSCAVFFYMFKSAPDRLWFLLALGMVAGGAFGNLHDRILLGHVRDFILFDFDLPGYTWTVQLPWRDAPSRPIPQRWPIFNVADMSILGGVGVLMVLSFFSKEEKKEKAAEPPAAPAAPAKAEGK